VALPMSDKRSPPGAVNLNTRARTNAGVGARFMSDVLLAKCAHLVVAPALQPWAEAIVVNAADSGTIGTIAVSRRSGRPDPRRSYERSVDPPLVPRPNGQSR
jgi:hypothetical protein